MTKIQISDAPAAGNVLNTLVTALIAKADPKDIQALLADSAVSGAVNAALGKAHELIEGEGFRQIEDLWDGSPNDRAPMRRTRPGGSMPDGIPVGSGESMRGGNAEGMGARYSDYAPQGGQQLAYEHLGRALGSVRKSVLQLVDVAQVSKAQQDATASAVGTLAAQIGEITKSLTTLAETVAKAQTAAPVVAKAEDEKKDEKKDEKDGDKDKNPFAKSMLDAVAKAVAAAEAAVVKGLEAKVAGDVAKAGEHKDEAEKEVEKARTLVEAAKSVDAALVTADLLGTVVKAQDRLTLLAPAAKSEATKDGNQKEWPASKEGTGKAAPSAADMTAAMDQISKALQGIGMLRTDLNGLMGAVGNQSRGEGLPPVFELAKSGAPDALAVKRTEINRLHAEGLIDDVQRDSASDLLARVEAAAAGKLPEAVVLANIAKSPAPIRQLFAQAA